LELFSDSNGNVFITDLNTKNGTYVNGRLLDGFTMLTFGDKVVLGQHHLFRWESYMQEKSNAKKSQENNRTEEIPYYSTVQNKKVNIEIIIIYCLITVILLVMAFLID
jgi:pSer/pThr/pTyr-binding forkhead associated (FHA) protein